MLNQSVDRFFSSYGVNHYTIDTPFQGLLRYVGLGKDLDGALTNFGHFAGTELLEVADYIDHVSPPRLRMWDVRGRRADWVQLNPAHKRLLTTALDHGMVRAVFTQNLPWTFHYALGYLLADPGLYCSIILTVQTAYALHKYGDDTLKSTFLPHYLTEDSDRAWFGATFYTELHGGSDLGANRAVARHHGHGWQIDTTDKYFASNAGIADAALVTARPHGRPGGPKGLALFFVPAFRPDGTANYRIRRLKEKLGTRAVPTGEVELQGTEAYLVGTLNHGIYQALEVLILARLGNAIGALGIARKAYLEAWMYARQRTAFGKPLIQHPLVQRDLLEMETEIEANLALTLKAVQAFDRSWQARPPYTNDFHYARFLAHIAKNMTADMSAAVTRQAMELHGGVGFLEDFSVARWHREALITPIWEGSSNIQALDLWELIQKKKAHIRFFDEIAAVAARCGEAALGDALTGGIQRQRKRIAELQDLSGSEAQFYTKTLLRDLGALGAAAFLAEAGETTKNKGLRRRFLDVARYYAAHHLEHAVAPLDLLKRAQRMINLT